MALRDPSNTTLILLSADVYMLFANDLAVYHGILRAAVGEAAYAQLRFVLASTHNHHVRPRVRSPPFLVLLLTHVQRARGDRGHAGRGLTRRA